MSTRSKRYSAVAMTLHWFIAAGIVGMILVGWWMGDAVKEPETRAAAYAAFQLHKSFGITILVLTVARLVWRLMNPPPPLPLHAPAWERFAAHATHAAFYAFAIGIPLTGLLYVSAGWLPEDDRAFSVATSYFGLFTVPHLPFIDGLAQETKRALAFMSMNAHSKMAWGVIVLLALHVGAALKHTFIDKDDTLAKMVPGLPLSDKEEEAAPADPRAFAAGVAFALVLGVATALIGAPDKPFPQAAAAPAPVVAEAPSPAVEAAPAAAPADTPAPAAATPSSTWRVDAKSSAIEFRGTHAGNDFKGRFESWRADIVFDPANVADARAVVTIDTGSAKTGDGTQESSLKEGEWLDPSGFPQATFKTSSIKSLGGERYEARGTLTLKGKATPVVLPFTLKIDGDKADMRGKLTLDRGALDVGMKSDPAAEWVSKSIEVEVRVKAARAG